MYGECREGEGKKLMEGCQIRKERGIKGSEGLDRGFLSLHI